MAHGLSLSVPRGGQQRVEGVGDKKGFSRSGDLQGDSQAGGRQLCAGEGEL